MAQYIPGGHFDPYAARNATHHQPASSTGLVAADSAAFVHARGPPRNWAATISLAMGLSSLVGLGPVGSILAIVFGHVGVAPEHQVGVGVRRAEWGLLLGYVTLAIWVIAVILIVRGWVHIAAQWPSFPTG